MYRFYIYDVNDRLIHASTAIAGKIPAEQNAQYWIEDNPTVALQYTGIHYEVEPVVIN